MLFRSHVPLDEHTPEERTSSALVCEHSAPAPHRKPQATSPQSTPTSSPLSTPSLQVGAAQVLVDALHTRLAQSAPVEHSDPDSHGLEHGPPQSTPASLVWPPGLFRTPSKHVAA